ncbi:MAG: CAP domain-containing protein [Gaiellaceae bacterium]|jgi:uncharacterized protein YkwD
MGVESRDWYRQPPEPPEPPEPSKRPRFRALFVLVGLFLALLATIGIQWERYSQSARGSDVKISILPGLPALTIHRGPLYPPNDPWKGYLASEQTCPGAERTDLPLSQQADIMVCLVNYARERRGLSALATFPLLNDTSAKKADKIVRCNDFAHDACGIDPVADTRAAGYEGDWGENLYVGEGRLGAPRVALDGWLNSPEHRANLFQPEWRSEGIAVVKVNRLGRYSDATVWVNEFASSS